MLETIKKKAMIGLGIFFLIEAGTDILGSFKGEPTLLSKWFGEIEFWLILGAVYLVARKFEKQKFLLWQETKRKWYFYVISVISVFLGAVIVGITVPLVFNALDLTLQQDKLQTLVNFYCQDKILMVFSAVTAGVVEELLFRGYIMPRVEILFKKGWIVIVVSALIFGLAHASGLSLIGVVVPILIGLIFSYHYYKYRNITALIIVHFLIDLASFINSCQ